MTEPPIEQRSLARLTSLRAFAALAVFFFHCGRDLGWRHLDVLSRDGYVGVGFFFVLSGFVLTWSARALQRPGQVYWRRFARIYPVYLVTLLIAAAYAAAHGGISLVALALGILLLQAFTATTTLAFGINGPAWSLSAEAAFYAVFPFLMPWLGRDRRRGQVVTATWLIAAAVVTAALTQGGQGAHIVALVNPLLRGSEFAVGIVLAQAVMSGWRPRVQLWQAIVLLVLGIAACRGLRVPSPLPDLLVAPLFALIIACGAHRDLEQRKGILTSRALVYAGEVSFAFYLVHERILDALAGHAGAPVITVLAFLLSAAAAVALHHTVERPARRILLARQPRVSA